MDQIPDHRLMAMAIYWSQGFNTLHLAKMFKVAESQIYRNLDAIKRLAKEHTKQNG